MIRYLPIAFALFSLPANASEDTYDLAITGVDIVDVESGTLEEDRTVLIADGTISRIIASSDGPPTASEIIDGTGKFLIPGLIDMHVHTNIDSLPLFLRYGVTTVRDMGTHFAPLEPGSGGQLELRDEIDAGTLDGPELILALRILDGDIPRNPRWAMHYASVATPEQGRALVNQVADAGGDFVKVYTDLTPDVFDAIVDQAEERSLTFSGHVPGTVGYIAAAQAGLRTAEHLRGIFIDVSSEEDRWRSEFAALAAELDPSATYEFVNGRLTEMAATRDPAKEVKLFEILKANDVGMVPTLVVLDDPRWRYPSAMPDSDLVSELSRIYQAIVTPARDPRGPFRDIADAMNAYAEQEAIVGRMHAAGVDVLVGTDASNPFVLPGISMHTELSNLVRAGMTPAEALRAATVINARYIDADDRIGSVTLGKEADLVLLEANPLADIAATRRIESVIVNGKLYAPSQEEGTTDSDDAP